MADCADASHAALPKFKQDVFAKLAFLGMPHGDVAALRHLWKVVNLSVRLGKDGAEKLTTHPEVPKLVKALSKDLGAPRADLFVKWLVEKVGALAVDPVAEGLPSESAALPGKLGDEKPRTKSVEDPEAKQDGDEAWVECKSKEGRKYYWDRRKNACSWSLPDGVRAMWVRHNSSDGRSYYADQAGKSFWVMPQLSAERKPNIKVAGEQSIKECRFHPELGVLKPLVLPPVPLQSSTPCDDLGPFEAALEPETPVLPAALVVEYQAISTPQCEIAPEKTTMAFIKASEATAKPSEACGSTTERRAHVTTSAHQPESRLADTTGLREEVLLLKKQLAELREKQSAVALLEEECRPAAEPRDKQPAIALPLPAECKPILDAQHEKVLPLTGTPALAEPPSDKTPLKRRKTESHTSGKASSEEEQELESKTSQQDDEWDSWSQTLDMLSNAKLPERLDEEQKVPECTLQLPEKLDEAQQKITDAYLSSFGAALPSSSESEEDTDVKDKIVETSLGQKTRKKPRNAINFWASGGTDVQRDAASSASSASSPSPCRTRYSRKRGRADSQSRKCDSEAKQQVTHTTSAPSGEEALDKFLTVVKYGTPPGHWGAVLKPAEKSANLTVFELRQNRRPSLGGA